MAQYNKCLFEAIQQQSEVEVARLLRDKSNTIVNGLDPLDNTPLVWTVMNVGDDEICCRMASMLIDSGAQVNLQNKIGYSALLAAVYHQSQRTIELLLGAGAWLTPTSPNELHLLAEKGNQPILEIFLQDSRCTLADVNSADRNYETPLYKAASNGHKECSRMLIDKGADMSHKTPDGATVMQVIFEHISRPAEFLVDLFDSRITAVLNNANNKKDYVVDFGVLAPKQCERQMVVLSNMLEAATEEETTEVLQHPLVELYLILKWRRICQFFYLWIVIYVIFVLSLWLYITLLLQGDEGYEAFTTASRICLIITGSGLLGHGILQYILSYKLPSRKLELWINIACTLLSVVVAVIQTEPINVQKTPNWVLHSISVAVLLAWLELMLLIGRLPTYGYYALMFATVLQNVVKLSPMTHQSPIANWMYYRLYFLY